VNSDCIDPSSRLLADDTPCISTTPPTAAVPDKLPIILGAVGGAIAALFAVLAFLLFRRRRTTTKTAEISADVEK